MSPTAQILGVAVAAFVIIGIGVGLQLLDARMRREPLDSDEEFDALEPDHNQDDIAPEGAVKVVPRRANSTKRNRKHGR